MIRKQFLSSLLPLPFLGSVTIRGEKKLKIFIKSAWGSDDPTRASFPFLHGTALAEAGHEVQIFLLGEGVSLMRDSTLNAITPVGWPPLKEIFPKVLANKSRFMLVVPVARPGASWPPTWRIKTPNSAIPRYLSA